MYRIIKRLIIITMLVAMSFVIIGNSIISRRAWNLMLDEFISNNTTQVEYFFSEEFSDLHDILNSQVPEISNVDDIWSYNNEQMLPHAHRFRIDYLSISNKSQTIQKRYGIPLNNPSPSADEIAFILENNLPHETICWYNNTLLLVASIPLYDNHYKNPEEILTIGRLMNENQLHSLQYLLGNEHVKSITLSKTPTFESVTTSHYKNISFSVPIMYGNTTFYTNLSFSLPMYEYFFVTTQNHIKAILCFFSLLIIVILLLTTKKISAHLNDTIIAINHITQGNFNEKLEIESHTLLPEINDISLAINTMSDEIEDKIAQIDNKYVQMIGLIVNAMEVNDAYTYQHSQMVSLYAVNLAKLIGFNNIKHVEIAGQFHDIGKISIPKHILNKPGKLTDAEYHIIRQHPRAGYKIIKDSDFHQDIKDGVLYHHERYDGTGYPKGLKGDDIPLIAQILSIADVYDALTSNRPYRRAMNQAESIQILSEGKGTSFNPELVDTFIDFVETNTSLYKEIRDSL